VYNVYPSTGASPLNPSPLQATSFDRAGVEFGKEECFVVRTAVTRGNLTIESPASPPACVTAADTFPPSAPKGLSAVANVGAISLIWDANTESDLAGYIVLRGEVPGDKLQAITATPIRETTFADKTAVPGTRYVYAVVAVDRATPANTSPQSARVEETAR
jgi:fibronectin type 3 domain-containing protein